MYHPQVNGLCDHFHRSPMAALHAVLSDGDLVDRLLWVMLGLRSAPKENLDASLAELVFGHPSMFQGNFCLSFWVPFFVRITPESSNFGFFFCMRHTVCPQ